MSDSAGPSVAALELPNAAATARGDASASEASMKDFPGRLQGMGAVVAKYSQKAYLQGYQDAYR